jgi:hypothetical protein
MNLLSGPDAFESPRVVAEAKAFNDAIKAKMPDTIWATGCYSWTIDKNGNIAS